MNINLSNLIQFWHAHRHHQTGASIPIRQYLQTADDANARWTIFAARCTLVQSALLRSYIVRLSGRLSVCLSVTFSYHEHVGWNSSKIISRRHGRIA